ncbi:MAG TPA: PhoH family protein, partial [Actinomycetota bacterium]|nr:PhoH family protein [Actinomycetota bacterium]
MAKALTQLKILVPGNQSMVALLGQRDEFLKLVERAFDTHILVRGNEITITGDEPEAERVARLFEEMIELIDRGQQLTATSVGRTIDMIKDDQGVKPTDILTDAILTSRGKRV